MSLLKKLHDDIISKEKYPYSIRREKIKIYDAIVNLLKEKPGLVEKEIESHLSRYLGMGHIGVKGHLEDLQVIGEIEVEEGKYYVKKVK